MAQALNKTDTAYILDMDGNHIAVFKGYAWPGLDAIITHYPAAFKVRVINRFGNVRATIPCRAK